VPVSFENLSAKVEAGEPLADNDAQALAESHDIIRLGMLATTVRRKLHGTEATFVRVVDLKLADLEVGSATEADLKAGTTAEADLKVGTTTEKASPGEFRIFETPKTLDDAVEVVTRALDLAAGTPVSAFCLFELSRLPEGLPVVLAALRKAGLELITQAPLDRLGSPESALEAVTDAGLQLTRLTMNDPPTRDWTAVCREVAALQTRLGSIRAFAPLPRNIDDTLPTTGYQDVKHIAMTRLLADNVESIQVDWSLYGPKLAQVALSFGADDIDSVSSEDDGSKGWRRSPLEEIRRNIRAAGLEPVERDGRFKRRG
jgi:aminodeoxyfutalosine synthase